MHNVLLPKQLNISQMLQVFKHLHVLCFFSFISLFLFKHLTIVKYMILIKNRKYKKVEKIIDSPNTQRHRVSSVCQFVYFLLVISGVKRCRVQLKHLLCVAESGSPQTEASLCTTWPSPVRWQWVAGSRVSAGTPRWEPVTQNRSIRGWDQPLRAILEAANHNDYPALNIFFHKKCWHYFLKTK